VSAAREGAPRKSRKTILAEIIAFLLWENVILPLENRCIGSERTYDE